jgi:hypothetical protein
MYANGVPWSVSPQSMSRVEAILVFSAVMALASLAHPRFAGDMEYGSRGSTAACVLAVANTRICRSAVPWAPKNEIKASA